MISGERWMFMWRSAPWFSSFTPSVSQPRRGRIAAAPSGAAIFPAGGGIFLHGRRDLPGRGGAIFPAREARSSRAEARPVAHGGTIGRPCGEGGKCGRVHKISAVSEMTSERGLRETVLELARGLSGDAGERGQIGLERPPKPDFGDYSTNAALLLAPAAGAPPRELARRLGEALSARLGGQLDRFEVAGPGFLNLFLSDAWHRAALLATIA